MDMIWMSLVLLVGLLLLLGAGLWVAGRLGDTQRSAAQPPG